MLLKRLLQSWLRQFRSTYGTEPAPAGVARTESMPGFNKLVRGRHGVYLANENDIYIGSALIHYGEFSELEWRLLQHYCRPGDVIVEVGANIGAHTVTLAKKVGPRGRIVAIEPQPIIFQTLCANLALNCLLNVETFNCGVGDNRRTLSLPFIDYSVAGNFGAISLQNQSSASSTHRVRVERLDDLLSGYTRVDLIKIDVEGMEEEVLNSGTQAIETFKPVLYVENDRVKKSRSLIETLDGMGYRMWWHIPPLFNADNYYDNEHNLYPSVGSFNMLCLHRSTAPKTLEGLEEVTDSTHHPLIRRDLTA